MPRPPGAAYPMIMQPRRLAAALPLALVLALTSSLAAAQPAEPREDRVVSHAQNLGVGLDWGAWGQGFAQSIHVDAPLFGGRRGGAFGLRVRGVMVYGPATASRFDPTVFGDLELFGRGPVLLGLARVYGGGGLFVGAAPLALPRTDRNVRVSGGGHMGIEVFASPYNSFYVEVGGQAPLHPTRYDAGASVMGGMTFYPFGS
jgi:hypothetical protein